MVHIMQFFSTVRFYLKWSENLQTGMLNKWRWLQNSKKIWVLQYFFRTLTFMTDFYDWLFIDKIHRKNHFLLHQSKFKFYFELFNSLNLLKNCVKLTNFLKKSSCVYRRGNTMFNAFMFYIFVSFFSCHRTWSKQKTVTVSFRGVTHIFPKHVFCHFKVVQKWNIRKGLWHYQSFSLTRMHLRNPDCVKV